MSYLLPLGYSEVDQVGHKFANLGKINDVVCVPQAVCLPADIFKEVLSKEQIKFLDQFFEELRATLGCFLLSSYPDLSKSIESVKIPAEILAEIKKELEEVFGSLDGRKFAVRSSGTTEDSENSSLAGVYNTKLNVKGFEEICSAIIECWLSYYSYTAVAARVRTNQFDSSPAIGIIIQEMIPSELSGVAFTDGESNDVVIEYVEGLGEQLVSGTVAPKRFESNSKSTLPQTENTIMRQVLSASIDLQVTFGKAVDIEWAWALDKLYILQVRPVTAHLRKNRITEPVFLKAKLYSDINLPVGLELGECREVYTSYVTKRAPSYRLAISNNVDVAGAYIVHFNGAGILGETLKIDNLFNSSIPEVVLDLSSNIRQVVIPKEELIDYLQNTLGLTPSSLETHTIIIREFVRGDYGFISRPVGEKGEGLLVEYSKDGLMDINRGTTYCDRLILNNVEQQLETDMSQVGNANDVEAFRGAIPTIDNFTKLMNKSMPGTQLEWVLEDGVPYFVDFSREQDEVLFSSNDGNEAVIVAKGVAKGPVFSLNDSDEMLYRLSIGPAVSVDKTEDVLEHEGLQELINKISSYSEKPIIYVQRPYAVLSTLFEHVSGFIFAEGSLLCHLAILLRENNIPSVIHPKFEIVNQDTQVMIADGLIQSMQNN